MCASLLSSCLHCPPGRLLRHHAGRGAAPRTGLHPAHARCCDPAGGPGGVPWQQRGRGRGSLGPRGVPAVRAFLLSRGDSRCTAACGGVAPRPVRGRAAAGGDGSGTARDRGAQAAYRRPGGGDAAGLPSSSRGGRGGRRHGCFGGGSTAGIQGGAPVVTEHGAGGVAAPRDAAVMRMEAPFASCHGRRVHTIAA